MKKILMFFVATALVFGIAANAGAIAFDIDESGSNVSTLGWTGVSALLVSGLDDEIFPLGDGESYTFDFFTLTVKESGLGMANIAATLAFSSPDAPSVTGNSGNSWFFNLFGIFSGGILTWEDLPQTIFLSNNGDYFDVDFEDIFGLWCGDSTNVSATITAHTGGAAAPVPEPATMLLFGCGLIGLAVVGRKKFQ